MFESIVIHAKSANQTFDEKKNPQQRCKQHPFAIHLFSLKPWGAFVSVRTVSLWDVYTNTYTEKRFDNFSKEVQAIFDKYIHNNVRRLKRDDAVHMMMNEFR